MLENTVTFDTLFIPKMFLSPQRLLGSCTIRFAILFFTLTATPPLLRILFSFNTKNHCRYLSVNATYWE